MPSMSTQDLPLYAEPDPLESEQDAKVRDLRQQATEDLKWLMGHRPGRRIVWRLLDRAGVYRTSFTGNSTTFFNEGARNVGLSLLSEIHEVCPDAYVLMLKESKSK